MIDMATMADLILAVYHNIGFTGTMQVVTLFLLLLVVVNQRRIARKVEIDWMGPKTFVTKIASGRFNGKQVEA